MCYFQALIGFLAIKFGNKNLIFIFADSYRTIRHSAVEFRLCQISLACFINKQLLYRTEKYKEKSLIVKNRRLS